MQHIVLGSKNPVKAQATLAGFQCMFPTETFHVSAVSVASGVSPQPLSGAETLHGALERARQALRVCPEADYSVGIEGGIDDHVSEMTAFAWIVVLSHEPRLGKACTGTFTLPEAVAALVRQGKELGEADDIVFGGVNSKQEQGAVGLLTGNVIDRTQLYTQAIILALIPFKQRALYAPLQPGADHSLGVGRPGNRPEA